MPSAEPTRFLSATTTIDVRDGLRGLARGSPLQLADQAEAILWARYAGLA